MLLTNCEKMDRSVIYSTFAAYTDDIEAKIAKSSDTAENVPMPKGNAMARTPMAALNLSRCVVTSNYANFSGCNHLP